MKKNALSHTRAENYPEWYQQVIKSADLADNSPVRGCMVIKPNGYAIWESIQKVLDKMFKKIGVKNAYFPLFIPLRFFQKEAEHVAGFAKECAVVTHSKLVDDGTGKLVPSGELEEPLIVRPTSETIIGEMFSKWVQSYRDLPLKINQWANVVRWEMRTRMFLRTSEFLWQEGHTVFATADEAVEDARKMLECYRDFAENFMAMPVICGEKTSSERFPGADSTFCIEAMMQDKKALQAGTSHFLGQHFAKSANIQFTNEQGEESIAWTASWGVSTRLIGGMIMAHSDDDGLILPPRLAPVHVMILPILRDENKAAVLNFCEHLSQQLSAQQYCGSNISVEIDRRDISGGEKFWDAVKRGIPVRIEIGARDIEKNSVCVYRRDCDPKEKSFIGSDEFVKNICATLDDIQNNLFARASVFKNENTVLIDSKADFYEFFKGEKSGFALAHWNGSSEIEKLIKADLGVTVRCIPFDDKFGAGVCPFTGEKSEQRVVWAKSY